MKDVARRAGIYVRISSDPEGLRLGVRRQLEDCERRCDELGWSVVGVYEDNDRSAYRGKPRPGYERMLGDIRDGRIDAVVVWAQDRLTRHPKELEEFFEVIDEVGDVELVTVAGRTDLATPEGQTMARIEGAIARRESDDKSRRIRRKAAQLAQEGKVGGGGYRPFGFETDRVTVRESEAALIRDAASRLLAGEAQGSILREWEARGVETPTGKIKWAPSVFRRMMRSPRIAGIREHRGEEVGPAEWDPIIDAETHRRLLERLKGTGAARGYRERRYMLTGGPAVCGLCGEPLVAQPREGKRSMVCPTGPGRSGCGGVRIITDPFEDFVGQAVIEALDGPMLIEAIRADQEEGNQDAALADELAAKHDALDQAATDFYTKGEITRSQFMAASGALQGEIDSLRSKLSRSTRSRILTALPTTRHELQAAWDQADIGWRRGLVLAVIDRIEVHPAIRGRNTFDPNRLQITWHA